MKKNVKNISNLRKIRRHLLCEYADRICGMLCVLKTIDPNNEKVEIFKNLNCIYDVFTQYERGKS